MIYVLSVKAMDPARESGALLQHSHGCTEFFIPKQELERVIRLLTDVQDQLRAD